MNLQVLNLSGNEDVEFEVSKLLVLFLFVRTNALFTLKQVFLRRFLKSTAGLNELLQLVNTYLKKSPFNEKKELTSREREDEEEGEKEEEEEEEDVYE